MKALLAAVILFGSWAGWVCSDDNIYGPGGAVLGPDGDPEQIFREIERQRRQQEQIEQQKRRQQQEAVAEYKSGFGLILRPQYNGHYFVDGAINDIPLVFTIDTGASFVTLPEQVASKAGIKCERQAVMDTANGKAKACTGMIANLKLGHYSITDVQCLIAPTLNQALLGNNVLRMFKILQHNGELRITK
ncbi:MAG: retropepsin-like aspartic protease family protein [Gammaproteobacteria bacterium]